MTIAAILLAAGASSRFGDGDKLLADIDGKPMIQRACRALADVTLIGDIVVVVAPQTTDRANAAGHGRWRLVENPDARFGMATSLRCGLNALTAPNTGVLVALADMPMVTSRLVAQICDAFAASDHRRIAFPVDAAGKRGHPVIWPCDLLPLLVEQRGDRGGKSVLIENEARWLPVDCTDDGAFFDVDTVEDLHAVREKLL